MKRYENKRNGKMYETTGEVDLKCKTLIMKEIVTGKEQVITLSTLKRWYVFIEEVIEEVPEPEKEPEKKTRKKKENPEKETFLNNLDTLLKEYGYLKITYEKVRNFIVLRKEEKGKIKFEFYTSLTGLKVNMKEAVANELDLEYKLKKNYFLPAVVSVDYTDTETINNILNYYE